MMKKLIKRKVYFILNKIRCFKIKIEKKYIFYELKKFIYNIDVF